MSDQHTAETYVRWRHICCHCNQEYDYAIPVTDEQHPRREAHEFLLAFGWTPLLREQPDLPGICPKCSEVPQASGGVGTILDGVLHLDVSDEATRQRALELAVEWTCRHRWPDSAGDLVAVADVFRAYLADGTVPEVPQ
ncbi:hypothetical protein J1771_gp62 [Gordonia phage MelBins]|uniref:Uncharacterized protein n=1 Tax=Gordonia phage MelBins TaxID=2656540 RepID=A0A649VMH6_9CAUD|nr:hypothetical protein J1771_gp62 [Gordonia phage MelBins]QGJ93616.1 hypothetical protein SEA_MELBINS_62 [Gordonia phage MelBins]